LPFVDICRSIFFRGKKMKARMTPTLNPDFLTREQAAATLQVSERTIDRYIRDGRLEARKPSARVVRIPAASLERLMS
jgi:excisionase family DNA binding protein